MDGATFRERVTAAKSTELDRIESTALLVLDGVEPDPRAVLEAAADSEHAAHTTFSRWASDEPNDRARTAFTAVADREAGHRERVLGAIDGAYEPKNGGALHEYLRGREGAIIRAASGMVGRGLVAERTHSRLAAFFDGRGDAERADLFRALREETEAGTDRGLELLTTLCEGDDWADAAGVAEYTVQVVADDYADALARADIDAGAGRRSPDNGSQ